MEEFMEKLPLLYYPKPDTAFHLKVDASLFAIGGTLEQEQGGMFVPLGFASKIDLPNCTHLDLRLVEAEDDILLARESIAV
jgi:hypothetical protein